MKKITCEMCGSTDVLKQDGLYVCQSCDTKYTVEEARKLMIEGTVEVQGAVEVKNAAQLDNLLELAQSSFDSLNYAQAENFCNQVIAIDSKNYLAWKLKGEAINYQITANNNRITEVYNCIMTAYEVLDPAEQEEKREEILATLRVCLEGEIDFALELFMTNRPTDVMLEKVKETFKSCASEVITAYKKLGFAESMANDYRSYIKDYFITKVNSVVESTWNDVVSYNYYRGGFTESYRPDNGVLKTFIAEGSNLLRLLEYADIHYEKNISLKVRYDNYCLQLKIQKEMLNACSFKRMVSTTTNGYGAVISRSEYWEKDQEPTAQAKELRRARIRRLQKEIDDIMLELAQNDAGFRDKMIKQLLAEKAVIPTGLNLNSKNPACMGEMVGVYTLGPAAALSSLLMLIDDEVAWTVGVILAPLFGALTAIILLVAYCHARKGYLENKSRIDEIDARIGKLRNCGE